mmetsp:Transcript_5027/g.12660  ORF Transcript_5027/g.12660 Transcript_5027/m.12660 type:complete len:208 (+) Transcript_5027:649-1272(+)
MRYHNVHCHFGLRLHRRFPAADPGDVPTQGYMRPRQTRFCRNHVPVPIVREEAKVVSVRAQRLELRKTVAHLIQVFWGGVHGCLDRGRETEPQKIVRRQLVLLEREVLQLRQDQLHRHARSLGTKQKMEVLPRRHELHPQVPARRRLFVAAAARCRSNISLLALAFRRVIHQNALARPVRQRTHEDAAAVHLHEQNRPPAPLVFPQD